MVTVRRFEPGFSTDFYTIRAFLARHGYELTGQASWGFGIAKINGKGRPQRVHWSRVIDLVDRIRIAIGLEPIRRTAA